MLLPLRTLLYRSVKTLRGASVYVVQSRTKGKQQRRRELTPGEMLLLLG